MKKSTSKINKVKILEGVPLAVVGVSDDVVLLSKTKQSSPALFISWSSNGVDFVKDAKKIVLKTLNKKPEKINLCYNFSLSKTPNGFVMTYFRKGNPKIKNSKEKLVVARSKDLHKWEGKSERLAQDSKNATVVYDKQKDKFEMYRDGLFIKNQASYSLSVWKEKPSLVFTSRAGQFDAGDLKVIGSTLTSEGIVVMYDASVEYKTKTLLQIGAVIIDINNPRRVIWRAGVPVWQGVVDSKDDTRPIEPIGFAVLSKSFVLYWLTEDGTLIVAKIPPVFRESEEAKRYPKIMDRYHGNPVIQPIRGSSWQDEGTFNPAAFQDEEGDIHLLYRAVGGDGISRVGYAKSTNGKDINYRLSHPVFEPSTGFGLADSNKVVGPIGYNTSAYSSGGSWTGAEDPRTVLIDGRVYMIYVVFEGWSSTPRLALTSISIEDFKAGKWKWKKPIKISPPDQFYKNWLLFPEKINGKFAIIHSIEPSVLIEYVDNLEDLEEENIQSRHPREQKERTKTWDTKIRGSGPPPLRTELGWLLLYHATQKHESHKYKVGAMLLDLDDPTKVLYRSEHPILSPDMDYENDGKPGVVYASGAIIRGDDLYVYYGGGDKVVCVATTPLKQFLKYLVTGNAKPYQLKKA